MIRKLALVLLSLAAVLALLVSPASAARPFPETGYTVANDSFLDYFDKRGGAATLGYPVSRELDFLGSRVQFFQRAVLQAQPGGGVGLMNILDEGLMPYTTINGSSFPAPDPALIGASPSPAQPDYAARAVDFARAFAPDEWEGMRVNFFSTFSSTVSMSQAFPTGGGDEALLPLINLEIWGLPTSRPARDPANGNFVYLRFQRGIMHYDATTGLTQGVLLADYLKAVITGVGLPADLGAQASGSRLYRQYDNGRAGGMARAEVLPGTNLLAAFERDGVVVPTPAPVVPTPVPTLAPVPPTPAPPAATPTPSAPASIELSGSPQFTNVIADALKMLSDKTPAEYALVRQNVYRIRLLEDATKAYTDAAASTLNFDGEAYLVKEWYGRQDQQTQWVAGLIVHNAVHIDQQRRGAPATGPDAEIEALLRQQAVLRTIETTANPTLQFTNFVQKAIVNNTGWFGHYMTPPGPENP